MYILHGTWIPATTDKFLQDGTFCLWVETGASRSTAPGYTVNYLPTKTLEELVAQQLGIARRQRRTTDRGAETRHLLLPCANGKPLPSPELAKRLAAVLLDSAHSRLESIPISTFPVDNPLKTLGDLHFLATYLRDDLQLGQDLLFWTHYGHWLKQVLRKDQYIPALKYHALPGRRKGARDFEIYPGWEIVSRDLENRLPSLIESMPLACGAASEQPHQKPACYDEETLLRHFAECTLTELLRRTPLPVGFQRKINNTLPGDCLLAYDAKSARNAARPLGQYQQWQSWRQRITAQYGGAFQLGFQLLEGEDAQAPWYIRLLAISRRDPSLRLYLDDYWCLDATGKSAIKPSFGDQFEQQLLLDLGQAARMYPGLWSGLATDQPVGLNLSLAQAFDFLKEYAWVLEDAGFRVLVPAWWTPEGRQRARLKLRAGGRKAAASAADAGYFSLNALVRYRYELSIGDQTVTEQEWRQLVDAKTPLVQFRGQWIELDRDKMQQMLEFWQTHGHEDAELSLGELLRKAAADEEDVDVSRDGALAEMLTRLRDPVKFHPIADPPGIQGTLRDYQKRGVAWLQYLEYIGLNGCLADDMGLGKTLQVITRLVTQPIDDHGPTLLVTPTSVVGNWRKEIEKFAPQLRSLVHHGPRREQDAKAFQAACGEYDIVITSFALARRDAKLLQSLPWRRVVVDEAQNIKNPTTAQTKAILKLKTQHRLALTGTPVENRLMDLWSIFNFLNPGYLGKQAQFRRQFELPVQRDNDLRQSALLKKLVQPFILRRVKTDKAIIKDLPDKVENKQYCNLTKEQASLYEAVVKEVERELEEAEGIQRRGLILATLMRLKQVCNHPRQFLQDGSEFTPERSHKLERLIGMLEEVIAEGESLLIFTQFTEIGEELDKYLSQTLGHGTYYLHGGVSAGRRERMIEAFQNPETEPSAFILSLKAGGVGINLTRANHVFHFDRWWNPAVEDQATDRAFRIGQTRNVFVHKFVTLGTLEERIDQMIEDKKTLAGAIVGADESWLTKLDNASFKKLIALNRSAVMD
jgi:SNF2 family DNA or RNA helicase